MQLLFKYSNLNTAVCSAWDKGYRYGFNSMEKDNEINVNGGSYDFGARIYDSRLGRWLSLDPKSEKLPAYSPYTYCLNNPLTLFDPNGEFPYPIHIRSFAPFSTFGGGFSGDGVDRGYSTSLSVTSRVAQRFIIDPTKGTQTDLETWSDPTHHPWLGTAKAKPVGKISNFSKSFDEQGNSTVSFTSTMAGANPLVPGAPDIDVETSFKITENLKKGTLEIDVNQVGDRFPAAETFITDTEGNSLFIGVSPFDGNPYTSLPGNNKRPMMNSQFTVTIDNKGVFTGVIMGSNTYSISEWNNMMQSKPLNANEGSKKYEFGGGGGFNGGGAGGSYNIDPGTDSGSDPDISI
ncbi:MAG: RHS repeat-associated core domain-containing protein [Bacteroidota bacterium]|nr:RHS repeat-associated core domain-containing protein [Bacteroidota bacterium]